MTQRDILTALRIISQNTPLWRLMYLSAVKVMRNFEFDLTAKRVNIVRLRLDTVILKQHLVIWSPHRVLERESERARRPPRVLSARAHPWRPPVGDGCSSRVKVVKIVYGPSPPPPLHWESGMCWTSGNSCYTGPAVKQQTAASHKTD